MGVHLASLGSESLTKQLYFSRTCEAQASRTCSSSTSQSSRALHFHPLWVPGREQVPSQQLFRMHFGREWICSLIAVLLGNEGSGVLGSWALTRETPSGQAMSLELCSLGDNYSSAVLYPGPTEGQRVPYMVPYKGNANSNHSETHDMPVRRTEV